MPAATRSPEGLTATGAGACLIAERFVKEAPPSLLLLVAREPYQAVNRALSTWKEITAPRKVERTGIPATGV